LGGAYLYLRQYDAAINELSARAAAQKEDGIEFADSPQFSPHSFSNPTPFLVQRP
jgi:hypothetical protein